MIALQILWMAALMCLLRYPNLVPMDNVKDDSKKRSTIAKAPGISWNAVLQVILVLLGVFIFKGTGNSGAAKKALVDESGPIATYTWKAENEGMALAHQTIRREVADFHKVLESWSSTDSSTLEQWEQDSLGRWWTAHERHVRLHCQVATEDMYAKLSERITINTKVFAAECDKVYGYLKSFDSSIGGWATGNTSDFGKELRIILRDWKKYENLLDRHFDAEFNQVILPSRQAFTADEWYPLIMGFFDGGSKEGFSAVVHYLGETRFRQEFMKERGIPGFVWFLGFKKQLRYYENNVYKYIDALKQGTSP